MSIYMNCTTDEGLRPSELTVEVKDADGRSEFLRVDREFVKRIDGRDFLPVGLIQVSEGDDGDVALIELPHEADSGANRLWVDRSKLNPSDIGGTRRNDTLRPRNTSGAR